jgi:uncharacterized GH25 family protein
MRLLVVAATLTALAGPALAHDTWLLPSRFEAAPSGAISAEATSAMAFPKPETAVKPERVAAKGIRLAGATGDLEIAAVTDTVLQVRARADQPGIATLWIQTRPRTLDLKESEVVHYLEEIGASDTVGAQWRKSGRRPWRETYVKFMKTFVRVGDGGGDRSWAEPLGHGLEIVPATDPTALRAGDRLAVRVLREGKPLPDQPVGVQAAGRDPALMRTDSAGRVTFALDRPGAWLIKTTVLRPAAHEGEWESQFATLTFSTHQAEPAQRRQPEYQDDGGDDPPEGPFRDATEDAAADGGAHEHAGAGNR